MLKKMVQYWRPAVAVSVVVFIALIAGLSLRSKFVATAYVDIGGVPTGVWNMVHSGGTIKVWQGAEGFLSPNQLIPIERLDDIDRFMSNYVLETSNQELNNSCKAQAIYSPRQGQVKIICRADTEKKVALLVDAVAKPLIDRHKYILNSLSEEEGRQRLWIQRRIQFAEQAIDQLNKYPLSGLSAARIIEYRNEIQELNEVVDQLRSLQASIVMTRLLPNSIVIINRTPNGEVWLAVSVLSLIIGLFVSGLLAVSQSTVDKERSL